MSVGRLSISVAPEVEEIIRHAAAGAGLPVSTWLARVATHAASVEDGRRAVREHEAEHGALNDEDRASAGRVLDELGLGRTAAPATDR